MRSRVDFPQPDGPTSTMNSPSPISSSTSSTATTPPGNTLLTRSRAMPPMQRSFLRVRGTGVRPRRWPRRRRRRAGPAPAAAHPPPGGAVADRDGARQLGHRRGGEPLGRMPEHAAGEDQGRALRGRRAARRRRALAGRARALFPVTMALATASPASAASSRTGAAGRARPRRSPSRRVSACGGPSASSRAEPRQRSLGQGGGRAHTQARSVNRPQGLASRGRGRPRRRARSRGGTRAIGVARSDRVVRPAAIASPVKSGEPAAGRRTRR